ncbi:rRNA-processing protein UTP22 [Ascoidea rubescens DSM 1968]|uniref:Nrap protein n=1 Tax=Ascoidea rubescens DSM 1968 TaxID=1344418 RepID=A0A1D2VB12_9ASCO|nr:Nrap protein [Ascoidea rubescens DSM 1968]ODV58785.1 Nrap protein [Ascoidea rubescens DSM 1968]
MGSKRKRNDTSIKIKSNSAKFTSKSTSGDSSIQTSSQNNHNIKSNGSSNVITNDNTSVTKNDTNHSEQISKKDLDLSENDESLSEENDSDIHSNSKSQIASKDSSDNISEDISDNYSDNSFDEDDEDEDNDKIQPKLKKQKSLNHQQLSAQDVQIARETAEVFKSNIFKLKIDEVIKEIKLNQSHLTKIEKFLYSLYNLINNNINDSQIFSISDLNEPNKSKSKSKSKSKTKQKSNLNLNLNLKIPFCDPKPTNKDFKFQYLKPSDISVVGSYALKNSIRLPYNNIIDLAITMPSSLFEKKDYLNYRAFYKRSFYLAYLASNLISNFSNDQLNFLDFNYEYLNDDILTPTLKIDFNNPKNSSKSKSHSKPKSNGNTNIDSSIDCNCYHTNFSIRLIVCFPFNIFDYKKLLPFKNSIRIQQNVNSTQKKHQLQTPPQSSSTSSSNTLQTASPANTIPTPIYNSSLISNTTYNHYLKFIYKTQKLTDSFKEAANLGRIWLTKKGFLSGSISNGGFGNFEFTMLMALLLNGGGQENNKILLFGFSSYQLFKGIIKYLATQDLLTNGHLIFSSTTNDKIYCKYNNNEGFNVPTIFDKFTKLNILWKMSNYSYNLLRHEAILTLNALNETINDPFDSIFLKNNNIDYLKYDINLEIPYPTPGFNDKNEKNKKSTNNDNNNDTNGTETINNIINFGPLEKISFVSYDNFIQTKLYNILLTGLKERVHQISIKIVEKKNIDKNHKNYSGLQFPLNRRKYLFNTEDSIIKIGLILNQDYCEKLVTKGPLNSEKEAVEKFKKFWGGKSQLRRFKDGSINECIVWNYSYDKPIVLQIIKYLFARFFGKSFASKIATELPCFISKLPKPLLPESNNLSIINTSTFHNLKASFDKLSKILFEFNRDLPLNIKAINPNSSGFRYSSVLQPIPFAISNPDFFNEVLLQFESSKKWPDAINGLEDTKTAFLLKIYELLNNKYKDRYKAFMTSDKSIPYNNNIKILNIITPEGYGFSIKVLTERDEILYLRAVSNCSKDKRNLLEEVYLKFNQNYIGSIKHTRRILLISHHFQYYLATVRLFKRWLDDQLLYCHLNEELIELIVLKVFVDSEYWLPPSSIENGFLRVLYFIANWNWRENPIILDISKKLDQDFLSVLNSDSNGQNQESNIGNDNKSDNLKDILSDKLTIKDYQVSMSNFLKVRKIDPNGLRTQFFISTKDDPSGILWSNNQLLPIAARLTALSKVAMNLISQQGINALTLNILFKPALNDYDFVIETKSIKLSKSSGIILGKAFKNLIVDSSQGFNHENISDEIANKIDPVSELVNELNGKYSNIIIFSYHKIAGLNNKGENVITGLFIPSMVNNKKFRIGSVGYNIKAIEENKDEIIINKDSLFAEIARLGGDLITSFQYKGMIKNVKK